MRRVLRLGYPAIFETKERAKITSKCSCLAYTTDKVVSALELRKHISKNISDIYLFIISYSFWAVENCSKPETRVEFQGEKWDACIEKSKTTDFRTSSLQPLLMPSA